MSTNLLRLFPTLVGLIVFGLLTILYLHDTLLYYVVLHAMGIRPWAYPFLDSGFMFAMKRCWKEGVDVYLSVPCDVVPGNKMAYSPLWQRLPFLPTNDSARLPIGLVTNLLLLLSVAILPPARTARDAILLSLAVVSTMVCFALERNNIDVWIYLLVVVGTLLFIRSGAARVVAYIVFMIAGLLKYYPFLLFGLALKERPTRTWLIATLSATGLAVFVVIFWGELMEALANIPVASPFGDAVGIVNLPRALARAMAAVIEMGPRGQASLTLLFRFLLTVVVVKWAIGLAGRSAFVAAVVRLSERDSIWLVVGCLVMGGCYLLTQNVGYRGIYLLIVLSGLLALRRASDDPAVSSEVSRMALLTPLIMWMEGIRLWVRLLVETIAAPTVVYQFVIVLIWLVRELLWLNLERVLLAVLLVVAARSATGIAVHAWARRIVADWRPPDLGMR